MGTHTSPVKVGIREFRENLARFLYADGPVAVTSHGETVGIYVPVRKQPSDADREAFRMAGEQMRAMLAAAGVTEDELVNDFEELRRQKRRQKKAG